MARPSYLARRGDGRYFLQIWLGKTISIELTTSLVASGEFVGILPISVARRKASQAALRVLPIRSVGPRVSAEVVFVKNRTLNPPVVSFIDCVRNVVKASRLE